MSSASAVLGWANFKHNHYSTPKFSMIRSTWSLARRYSTSAAISTQTARAHCLDLLQKNDRSSFILQSYVPQQSRDAFVAIRAFNLETAKISDTASKPELAQMRFEFWKSVIQKSLNPNLKDLKSVPAEPVAVLLASSANQMLSKRFLITLVQTREQFVTNPPLRNIDALCSYGEGTYSQLNYLTQELMYSASPKVSEFLNEHPEISDELANMVAHIGQATGITTFLRGLEYYSTRQKMVPLPVDIMTKHGVSQQSVLDHYAGGAPLDPKLADVVFETATRANDHILSAKSILDTVRESIKSIPDAIIIPALTSVPVQLYLERLEKCNFNMADKSLRKNEWRLPYRSYKAYKLRAI